MTNIAFLGVGMMGAPMAKNLISAGFHVTVWNRTRSKAEAIAGATVANAPDQAIASADIIISILTDGAATGAIQSQSAVRAAMRPDQIWIEMASIKPAQARAQSIDLAKLGVAHLDAPVSGGTTGAQAATLAIIVGGDTTTFSRASPILAALGNPVYVGPSGTGQLAKLANQGIVGITIGAVAEAMLLLERGGADPAAVRRALVGGFADSTVLQLHGARMTDEDLTARATAAIQLKDMNNIIDEANELGLHLPMSADIQARFKTLCDDMGHGDLDQAALYLELLARNQSS